MRNGKDPMELAVAPPALPAQRRAEGVVSARGSATTSDGELLNRVARGDRRAFELLYRRYARAVYGLAIRRLGDRERAEDAVQETFTSVWRSARTYRPERGPGAPWLYSIARNAIVDRLRGRTEPPTEVPEVAESGSGPQERAENEWLAWRVHRALEELPENERTVIALAYWGGLSQSEIADRLSIPLGTVKTRTRSGLGRLASLLEGEDLR
jgi:RNA polymerase sigma-70 factor (ECF subfamily)